MDKEIIEGNRIIAEKFMVKRLEDGKYSMVLTDVKVFIKQPQWFSVEQLEYHSSWDWQNPVWVKVCSESNKIAMTKETADRHNRLYDLYSQCVAAGNVIQAFKYLVEGIKYINSNQPQQ